MVLLTTSPHHIPTESKNFIMKTKSIIDNLIKSASDMYRAISYRDTIGPPYEKCDQCGKATPDLIRIDEGGDAGPPYKTWICKKCWHHNNRMSYVLLGSVVLLIILLIGLFVFFPQIIYKN